MYWRWQRTKDKLVVIVTIILRLTALTGELRKSHIDRGTIITTCICYNTSVNIEITSRSEFSQYCAVGTVLSLSADSGLFVQALASKCIGLEKHHLVSSQPLRNQQQKDVTLFKRVFFLFPRTLFVKHLFLFSFFFWQIRRYGIHVVLKPRS